MKLFVVQICIQYTIRCQAGLRFLWQVVTVYSIKSLLTFFLMLTFKRISRGFTDVINRVHPDIRDSSVCTNSFSLHPVCVDCSSLFPSVGASFYPVTYWQTDRPHV
jgi:hypothetical protein